MMKNHYHLLLHTKKANISEGMWHLGRKFAIMVNRDINGDGPVFRNRFRSILIQDERYLLQVHRYIHLNPVEAALVTDPRDYKWSSCHQFCNEPIKKMHPFLKTNYIGRFLKSREEYFDFLNIGNAKKINDFYSRKNIPSTLNNQL